MRLKEDKLMEQAKLITELRESLRHNAAAMAQMPGQLQFFEEKELVQLKERVS